MTFASKDLTAGQLNALVKKVGGHEKVLQLLRGELALQLKSFDGMLACPTDFALDYLQLGNSQIAEEDKRADLLTSVDFTEISFATCLRKGEENITGTEQLKRLKAMPGTVRLGGRQCIALWKDWEERKGGSILEWLREHRGIESLDFYGLVVHSMSTPLSVVTLECDDGSWHVALNNLVSVTSGGAAVVICQGNLAFNQNVDLPARSEPFKPRESFQRAVGLGTLEIRDVGFKERILSANTMVSDIPATSVACFDLVNPGTDEQVRIELPDAHVFPDVSVFCWYLDCLIAAQTSGKQGPLATDGYLNTFYVAVSNQVRVVGAFWNAEHGRWKIADFDLGDDPRKAARRVFSAATLEQADQAA